MKFYVVKFYTQKNMLHNKTEKLQAAAIYQAVAVFYIDIFIDSCVYSKKINDKGGWCCLCFFSSQKIKKRPAGGG